MQQFLPLIEQSKSEKKGLTFFLPGYQISAVVTEIHGLDYVIGYNQQFSKIVIRLDGLMGLAIG